MKTKFVLMLSSLVLMACNPHAHHRNSDNLADDLYSTKGDERSVQFQADYETSYTSLQELQDASPTYLSYDVQATVKYLFGPLVNRGEASPQNDVKIQVLADQAHVANGHVMVPYNYSATWLVAKQFAGQDGLDLPVPYNAQLLNTAGWLSCTDSDPEHQTMSFYWYFWDPTRYGCDHKLGEQYQNIHVLLGASTPQTTETYPHYQHMFHEVGGKQVLQMTFAFGYVSDPTSPNPFRDSDMGALEFQRFHQTMSDTLLAAGFTQSDILQSDYDGSGTLKIGSRFTGVKDGANIVVSVVIAAGVDQMNLFARSFAQDHEAFFGWFGHSRVGSGFDADHFKQIVEGDSSRFSISQDYQLVYWGGCNSYSYYTLPFFQLKGGTDSLQIISNGLPSYFTLNGPNANIAFQAMWNWQQRTSFQTIVDQIEGAAQNAGSTVLVNVLGDEKPGT